MEHTQTNKYFQEFMERKNYFAQIIKDNEYKPGPPTYNVKTEEDFTSNHKLIKFAISKAPRKTFTQEIAERRKFYPEPGVYSPRILDRILGGEM
jgi:hypothetical protein